MMFNRRRAPKEPYTDCPCCRAHGDCTDCAEWRASNVEHICHRFSE